MKTKDPKIGGYYAYRENLEVRKTYTRKGVETKNSGKVIFCKKCEKKVSAVGSRYGTCRPCHEERWRIRKGLPPATKTPHGSMYRLLSERMNSGEAWCRHCQKNKTQEQFRIPTRFKFEPIYLSVCRECRDSERKKRVPLSSKDRARLRQALGNKCRICGLSHEKISLVIDHCHETDVIRGLLCTNCNTGIGLLKEDLFLLLRSIQYLKGNLG